MKEGAHARVSLRFPSGVDVPPTAALRADIAVLVNGGGGLGGGLGGGSDCDHGDGGA